MPPRCLVRARRCFAPAGRHQETLRGDTERPEIILSHSCAPFAERKVVLRRATRVAPTDQYVASAVLALQTIGCALEGAARGVVELRVVELKVDGLKSAEPPVIVPRIIVVVVLPTRGAVALLAGPTGRARVLIVALGTRSTAVLGARLAARQSWLLSQALSPSTQRLRRQVW